MTEPKSITERRREAAAMLTQPEYQEHQHLLAERRAEERRQRERKIAALDARAAILRLSARQRDTLSRLRDDFLRARPDESRLALSPLHRWIEHRERDPRTAPPPGVEPAVVQLESEPQAPVSDPISEKIALSKRKARWREIAEQLEQLDDRGAATGELWKAHEAVRAADFTEESVAALEQSLVDSAEPPKSDAAEVGTREAVSTGGPNTPAASSDPNQRPSTPAVQAAGVPAVERDHIVRLLKAQGKRATAKAISAAWRKLRGKHGRE